MFELLENQFTPEDITREEVLQRLICWGGEKRTVDGEERIYVYRIAWFIGGYDPDTHILQGRKLTPAEIEEWENATLPIYFSTVTDQFVCPPDGEECVLLIDNTLKISSDLEYIKNR